jgi:hypothetical protein
MYKGGPGDGGADVPALWNAEKPVEGAQWSGRHPGRPDVLLPGVRSGHRVHLPLSSPGLVALTALIAGQHAAC